MNAMPAMNGYKRKIISASTMIPALVYNEKPLVTTLRTWRTLSSISISNKNKYVYIRIPKAANSTVLAALYNTYEGVSLNGWDREFLTKKYLSSLGGANILNSREIMDTYFFFTFVRNPYERILSAYLQKFKTERICRRFPDIPSPVDFSPSHGFLIFLEKLKEKYLYSDHHWIPQYLFFWPAFSRLDFMGKVENIENDFSTLISRMPDRNIRNPGVNLNDYIGVGSSTTSAKTHSAKFYKGPMGLKCKSLVQELYERDFSLLGYSLDYPTENPLGKL